MRRPAKKLQLEKETLRTLSHIDLRAVFGGTDATPTEVEANCVPIVPVSDTCVDSSEICAVNINPNPLIGVNTVRRF